MSMKKAPLESSLSKSALFLAFFLFVELAIFCIIHYRKRLESWIWVHSTTWFAIIIWIYRSVVPENTVFTLFTFRKLRTVGQNITFKAFFQRFFLHHSSPAPLLYHFFQPVSSPIYRRKGGVLNKSDKRIEVDENEAKAIKRVLGGLSQQSDFWFYIVR